MIMGNVVNKDLLSIFHPLSLIAPKYHDLVLEGCQCKQLKPNEVLIRKPVISTQLHFLIDGSVEARKSFNERHIVSSTDSQACYPLEEQLAETGVIRACSSCKVLVVDADSVDRYLSLSQTDGYKIVHLDEGDAVIQEDVMIDDFFEEDWLENFIRSPLASHLPSEVLHQLFAELEDIDVEKGDVIIEKNTPGDYFYVIKKGTAMVLTDSNGPHGGQTFELGVGQFFGDEALVAETIRNATVVMDGDGKLGRLAADSFNAIIKHNLVLPIEADKLTAADNCQYVDVRLPIEYKHSHREGAQNIPISHLRKQLDFFNVDQTYVITADGGRRSELAVYLLRQAGITSYYVQQRDGQHLNFSE